MNPAFEGYAEKVRASFARQALMSTFGAQLSDIAPGHIEITAPILDIAKQQHGFGHAGLTFALGDSAAGYAALSLMPKEAEVLTVEMKINLMRPASGQNLRATGKVIKPGRTLTVVSAEVFADKTLIAHLQGTMITAAR